METVRLTTAQAVVRFLVAQRCEVDGAEAPLFPGVFAIFGHGNVTALGEALAAVGDALPTWRGQNEQGMAMAAIGFAKAVRRRQVMIATSSIGPGALNMVTAAGIAMANRLPVLLISGDTFASRCPTRSSNRSSDSTIPRSRSTTPSSRWCASGTASCTRRRCCSRSRMRSRCSSTLPTADRCSSGCPRTSRRRRTTIRCQFFADRIHRIRRPRPDPADVGAAADILSRAERPLVIAGGGVRYSQAEAQLAALAERHRLPVAETVAGKGSLAWDHPANVGPIGVTGSTSANALAADADVVVAVGHPAPGLHHRVVDRLRRRRPPA